MSGMFKSKSKAPDVSVVADPYQSVREPLNKFLNTGLTQPAPSYTGELVAPMSAEQKSSLDYLKNYVTQPQSQSTISAQNEVNKTLSDDYDPTTSPYYQAVKAEANRNLNVANEKTASDAAGGGRYWTGARLAQQGDNSTNVMNSLNTMLGSIAQQERQNKLAAVPLAAQLGLQEQQQPLQAAQALQTLGAVTPNYQNALDQATYNEWLRANQNYPLQIAQLGAGLRPEPYYAQNTQQPSIWSQIAPLIGTVAGGMVGGPAGAAAGNAIGSSAGSGGYFRPASTSMFGGSSVGF